jgi:hypothetical protein
MNPAVGVGAAAAMRRGMNAVSNALTLEGRTIFTLPRSLTIALLARRSRAALLSFANDAERWGKPELAMWLTGPYTLVTQTAHALVDHGPHRPRRFRAPIEPRALAGVMSDALAFTRGLLRASQLKDGGGLTAWDAWQRGLIARCEDIHLNEGWAPLDLPELRLRDRLTALWAADYLTHTADYESALTVCEVCERASFDPFLRPTGRCELHTPRHIEVQWPDGDAKTYTSHLTTRVGPTSGIRRR